MFVVVLYETPDYHKELISVEGIVYNEGDFNRYLDKRFPTLRSQAIRVENEYGPLSISYEMLSSKGSVITDVVMMKINEIGQPTL